jgi:hypothetical protein
MNPYRIQTERRPSFLQWLKCRWGLCFAELVRIEKHDLYDLWVQRCPYCGREQNVIDEEVDDDRSEF